MTSRIIRSLAESISDWDGKSKLKKLRKFIATYCPEVLDDMEIMTGITENWRVGSAQHAAEWVVGRYHIHFEEAKCGGKGNDRKIVIPRQQRDG